MKKLITIIIFMLGIMLISCEENNKKYSYIVFNSITNYEFVVDDKYNVVAFNGLDDFSKLLITDEDFINVDIFNTINKVLDINITYGMLVKNASNDDISISLGGSFTNENLHILEMKIINEIEMFIINNRTNNKVNVNNLLSLDDLQKRCIDNYPFSRDDITNSDIDTIISYLIETVNEDFMYQTLSLVSLKNVLKLCDFYSEFINNINIELPDLNLSNNHIIDIIKSITFSINDLFNNENFNNYYLTYIDYIAFKVEMQKRIDNGENIETYLELSNEKLTKYNISYDAYNYINDEYLIKINSYKDELQEIDYKINEELFNTDNILDKNIILNKTKNYMQGYLATYDDNVKSKVTNYEEFTNSLSAFKLKLKNLVNKGKSV